VYVASRMLLQETRIRSVANDDVRVSIRTYVVTQRAIVRDELFLIVPFLDARERKRSYFSNVIPARVVEAIEPIKCPRVRTN
jgi:hypothetical protein